MIYFCNKEHEESILNLILVLHIVQFICIFEGTVLLHVNFNNWQYEIKNRL